MRGDPPSGLPAWAGRSPSEWAAELGVPHLELHHRLSSTNAHIRALAVGGARPFTTVVAGEQSAGRGRKGRAWHSPPNSGLWLSILLPLEREGAAGVLPLAVGVAVARAIEAVSGVEAGLKWPNDVLVGRLKVAGILCESAAGPGGMVAAGIGVNVRRPTEGYPGALDSTVGFLQELGAKDTSEPGLAAAIVGEIRAWAHPIPRALSGPLRMEWELRDRLRDRVVRLDSGVTGTALGVTVEGSLSVAVRDGSTMAVRTGSVRIEGAPQSGEPCGAGIHESNQGEG